VTCKCSIRPLIAAPSGDPSRERYGTIAELEQNFRLETAALPVEVTWRLVDNLRSRAQHCADTSRLAKVLNIKGNKLK